MSALLPPPAAAAGEGIGEDIAAEAAASLIPLGLVLGLKLLPALISWLMMS